MSLKDTLTKQVGPLPLGGWIVVVIGGLAIGYVVRRREVGSSSTATQTADSAINSGDGLTNGALGNWTYTGSGATAEAGNYATSYKTNDEWRQAAIRTLLAHGFQSSTLIESAIGAYFTGQPLTQQQASLIDTITGYIGATPYGVPAVTLQNPIGTTPDQTPTPETTTPTQTIPAGSGQIIAPVIPITSSPASVSVPTPAPAVAQQVPNPIPGDTSTVVVGQTQDGHGYVYGGSAAQAALLAPVATPAPAPYNPNPASPIQLAVNQSLPQANGQANYYTTPDGFKVTYG